MNQNIVVVVVIIGFIAYRLMRARKVKAMLPQWKARNAQIVDVRSLGEFEQASNPESINIPLNQLESRVKELNPNRPTILCCASGARSGMALMILKRHGFLDVINAGAWTQTL